MINQKKKYEAPKVSRVKLVVKEAVLGTCHASPVLTPKIGSAGCELIVEQCWYPPGWAT